MAKVALCGCFGFGEDLVNGQTIKTKNLAEGLEEFLGKGTVELIDTHKWSKNPIVLLWNCFKYFIKCDNFVILPAQNGIKVFIPLIVLLNVFFNKKIHYVVIGAWLSEKIEKSKVLKFFLYFYDGVYVETDFLLRELESLGLKNIEKMNNFKKIEKNNESELIYIENFPIKLCIFSRVMREKGIEDAINVVSRINSNRGKKVYTLDIYGPIDQEYKMDFELSVDKYSEFINYCGVVRPNESVRVLKNYSILLFPTRFKTEGIPGTIIDAYVAGIPVISSNWNSAREIIEEGKTGFIYDFNEVRGFEEILLEIAGNYECVNLMKINCLEKAKEYEPKRVIGDFIKHLK